MVECVLFRKKIYYFFSQEHIRKIETEEKAKDVASVWGTEFIQFLAALAIVD